MELPRSTPVTVQERVRVAVDFAGPPGRAGSGSAGKVRPLVFLWRGRKYVVDRVNLVYKKQHGDRFLQCFAVSDPANSYILVYDPEEMSWMLEEIYARE